MLHFFGLEFGYGYLSQYGFYGLKVLSCCKKLNVYLQVKKFFLENFVERNFLI